jgi:hypothetical protein
MQCILYKIYFWKGFSYLLQIDMHLICAPMLKKLYSCKKWVLQPGETLRSALEVVAADERPVLARNLHYEEAPEQPHQ